MTETEIISTLARRIFGAAHPLSVERVPEGVSARVYRVLRSEETF